MQPMGARSTLWIAAIATAAATAYASYKSYVAYASIDGIPIPEQYREPNTNIVRANPAPQ